MNQNVRMTLAIVLCAVIYFVWMSVFAPKPTTPVVETPLATTSGEPSAATVTAPGTNPNQIAVNAELETHATPQTLSLRTSKAEFLINTQGGVVTSAALHDYKATAESDSPTKNLLTETPGSSALFLGIDGYPNWNAQKTFEVVSQNDREIRLQWTDGTLQINKTIALDIMIPKDMSPEYDIKQATADYDLIVSYQIINLGTLPLTLTPYWQTQVTQKVIQDAPGFLSFLSKRSTEAERYLPFYALFDGKKNKTSSHVDWNKLTTLSDKASWAGINDRYFLVAIAPQQSSRDITSDAVYTRTDQLLTLKVSEKPQTLMPLGVSGASATTYFGPKKSADLKRAGAGFEIAIDNGFFGILAEPILWLMLAIHKIIPSWGLAIILLTFIVKIMLYPINKKSMASMKAMQQLQPKLEEIRKKFPDDKQKQNVETMQLFRTHKVNPLGGCLPMLLQLPIYFALYRVLWNAIEFYHTPFLHYKDLSAPDPYFVAPVIMGIFMFLQQKFTPSPSTDPAQKKMMLLMPIFFSAVMLFLPVGLVIYICVNTSMSVLQQYLMRKDISLRDVIFRKVLRLKKADGV